jgi:hypothetical protein
VEEFYQAREALNYGRSEFPILGFFVPFYDLLQSAAKLLLILQFDQKCYI